MAMFQLITFCLQRRLNFRLIWWNIHFAFLFCPLCSSPRPIGWIWSIFRYFAKSRWCLLNPVNRPYFVHQTPFPVALHWNCEYLLSNNHLHPSIRLKHNVLNCRLIATFSAPTVLIQMNTAVERRARFDNHTVLFTFSRCGFNLSIVIWIYIVVEFKCQRKPSNDTSTEKNRRRVQIVICSNAAYSLIEPKNIFIKQNNVLFL